MAYRDADGSELALVAPIGAFSVFAHLSGDDVLCAVVAPPRAATSPLPLPPLLDVVALGAGGGSGRVSAAAVAVALDWLLDGAAALTSVVGLDTESDARGALALAQLCVFRGAGAPARVLLLHARARAWPALGARLGAPHALLCAGAEFVGDALLLAAAGVPLSQALDLTPLWAPAGGGGGAGAPRGQTVGLRAALDAALGCAWVKEKAHALRLGRRAALARAAQVCRPRRVGVGRARARRRRGAAHRRRLLDRGRAARRRGGHGRRARACERARAGGQARV